MDIDLDLPSTFEPNSLFKQAVTASMVKNGDLVKHPCGAYFQNMPVDSVTGLAAIPFDKAEDLGFFKIDFLHLSLLDQFKSKTEVRQLMNEKPDWDMLLDTEVVQELFQIHKREQLLKAIKPRSVQSLADCIALIRPGKKHLIPAYIEDPERVRHELYAQTTDGYRFKKSHAISYALTIVLQLNAIRRRRQQQA